MKSYFFTLILLLFFIASIFTVSLAQEWDEMVVDPCVFFDGNMYHMWYSGVGEAAGAGRTGYAISQDGIMWTKDTLHNPVLDIGPPGSLDAYDAGFCSVLLIGDIFHMWYSSDSHPDADKGDKISHATSLDGIIWTKDTLNNPVLDFGQPGSWDDSFLWAPDVIFDGNTYHMWYEGWGGGPEGTRIGHAVSLDGIDWIKDTLNPVLSYDSGKWDDKRVGGPEVVFDGTTYHMWYTGGITFAFRIGYATSSDGRTWTKDTMNNPVLTLGAGGTWDRKYVGYCSVLYDTVTTIYKMWYTGGVEDWQGEIGYATSPDGIIWEKNVNPVLTINNEIRTGMPNKFRLFQNYPNPFNPTTMINYQLPMSSAVELSIYNLLGQKVATLVSERKGAGYHQVEWDASRMAGMASGIYLYRLKAEGFVDTKKMILMR